MWEPEHMTFEDVLSVFATWCWDCKKTVRNTIEIERTWICYLEEVSSSSYKYVSKENVQICPDCYARWLARKSPYRHGE